MPLRKLVKVNKVDIVVYMETPLQLRITDGDLWMARRVLNSSARIRHQLAASYEALSGLCWLGTAGKHHGPAFGASHVQAAGADDCDWLRYVDRTCRTARSYVSCSLLS